LRVDCKYAIKSIKKLEHCSESYPSLCKSIKIRWVSMFLLSALFRNMFRPNWPSAGVRTRRVYGVCSALLLMCWTHLYVSQRHGVTQPERNMFPFPTNGINNIILQNTVVTVVPWTLRAVILFNDGAILCPFYYTLSISFVKSDP
jgi:hypothetical protein